MKMRSPSCASCVCVRVCLCVCVCVCVCTLTERASSASDTTTMGADIITIYTHIHTYTHHAPHTMLCQPVCLPASCEELCPPPLVHLYTDLEDLAILLTPVENCRVAASILEDVKHVAEDELGRGTCGCVREGARTRCEQRGR